MEYLIQLHKDKLLKKATVHLSIPVIKKSKNIYLVLCASVISQQLSTVVATVINKRFLELFKDPVPTPQQILQVPVEKLRTIGLSGSKASYIHNICAFFIEHDLDDRKLYKLDDEALIDQLVQIKGIGRWSVEMLLMFAMARPDVFATDDLGIQKAMSALYGIDESDKKKMKVDMEKVASKWKPYRTNGCLYLWAWYNNQKKQKKLSVK